MAGAGAMTTEGKSANSIQGSGAAAPASPTVEELGAHLEAVLASPVFRTSKRSQKLLQFVVEHAAMGRTELLKERTIGVEVFARPPEYEPSEDAIVRVNANEVRKRLAQYYLSAGRDGVWIELPAGSYVPEFHKGPPAAAVSAAVSAPPASAAPAAASGAGRRGWWAAAAGVLVVAVAGFGVFQLFREKPPIDEFWAPTLQSAGTPLICVPIGPQYLLSYRLLDEVAKQKRPDAKPVLALPGEIDVIPESSVNQLMMIGTLEVALFVQRQGRTPEIRLSAQLATGDLRGRPVILLGAFNNPWTLGLNRDVRFAFERQDADGQTIFVVQDRKDPGRKWRVVGQPRFGIDSPDVDYAIVTRVFERSTGQALVSAAGISQQGTRAATEFITNPVYWQEIARGAPAGWQRQNLQVVLETNVVLRTPKPPRVVAVHFWK